MIREFNTVTNSEKKNKSWYVTYRLVSNQVDNYRTVLRPDGCVNVKRKTPLKNIGIDTSHNGVEKSGELTNVWLDVEQSTGIVFLYGTIRFGAEHFVTNKEGQEVMPASQAYEEGLIKGVSVEFNPLNESRSVGGIVTYDEWVLLRVAILTSITGDAPGQPDSGEVSSEYRTLSNNLTNKYNNKNVNLNNMFYNQKRCLCLGASVRQFFINLDDRSIWQVTSTTEDTTTLMNLDNQSEVTLNNQEAEMLVELNEDHMLEYLEGMANRTERTEEEENTMRECKTCLEKIQKQREEAGLIERSSTEEQVERTQETEEDREMETNDQDQGRNMDMLKELNFKMDKMMEMMERMASQRSTQKDAPTTKTDIENVMRNFVEKYKTQKEVNQYQRTKKELEDFNQRLTLLNKNVR